MAALFPGPGMAVYYASKAYVLSLSEALHYELKSQGVSVTALCPGPTESDFFRRAGIKSGKFGKLPLMGSMPVAEAGYRGLMARRRVVVPGALNRLIWSAFGLAPRSAAMALIAKMQFRRRRSAS